eukprot:6451679-Lingulodinium_polyedra.AAC.1
MLRQTAKGKAKAKAEAKAKAKAKAQAKSMATLDEVDGETRLDQARPGHARPDQTIPGWGGD